MPPYCATYSLTIFWLAALVYPGYQPFGTIMPVRVARAHRVDERRALVRAGRRDEHFGV